MLYIQNQFFSGSYSCNYTDGTLLGEGFALYLLLKFLCHSSSKLFGGLHSKNIAASTSQAEINITPASGYEKVVIKAGANFNTEISTLSRAGKNYLVVLSPSVGHQGIV